MRKEAAKLDANSVGEYLKTLKSKTGTTTKSLSDLTGIPEDTINNVLYARTASPSLFIVADLVHAMGGTLAELAGEKQESEGSTAPDGGGKLFDIYRATMERGVRQRNIAIIVLLVVLLIVVAILLTFAKWLVWDITHPGEGLIHLWQLANPK